ncbi:L-aspartate oxidase [Ralstonia solanacearum]|nr:L-aspartate oxidase [Ralstonia solanacearum]
MPKVKFIKPFKFSPDGIEVVEYAAGNELDVDDLCASIACENGYAEELKSAAKATANRSGKAQDGGSAGAPGTGGEGDSKQGAEEATKKEA